MIIPDDSDDAPLCAEETTGEIVQGSAEEQQETAGGMVESEGETQDFESKKLHPGDLKQTVGNYLVKIISPVREKLNLSEELFNAIKKSY